MSKLMIIKNIESETSTKLERRELDQLFYPSATGYSIDTEGMLSGLNLNGLKLNDYSFLRDLTDLKVLCLAGADLFMAHLSYVSKHNLIHSEYTFFDALRNLSALDLSHTSIDNINFLKHLKSLSKIRLNGLRFFKRHNLLEPLSYLTALTHLEINGADIRHIQVLDRLKNLEYLDLEANDIDNLYSLKSLINLSYLDLARNDIVDIQPLEQLHQLTDLDLSENEISDLNPLKNLRKLTSLNLNQNRINNISPLEKLTSLKELYLCDNQINTIAPLLKLKSLQELDLTHNTLKDSAALESLKKRFPIQI